MTVCGWVNVLLVEGALEEPLGIEEEGGGRVRERVSLTETDEGCGGGWDRIIIISSRIKIRGMKYTEHWPQDPSHPEKSEVGRECHACAHAFMLLRTILYACTISEASAVYYTSCLSVSPDFAAALKVFWSN